MGTRMERTVTTTATGTDASLRPDARGPHGG
jgi:hypothetical protein